jgi:NTP pyrophosphatase (non-canonical NTP hydrolase)
MNDYQRLAETTANRGLSGRDQIANGALGLVGEAGEAADLLKNHLFHGHPLDSEKMKSELGDILWYVATLAGTLGLDLDDVAEFNVAKLKARYPEGFSEQRSRSRSE